MINHIYKRTDEIDKLCEEIRNRHQMDKLNELQYGNGKFMKTVEIKTENDITLIVVDHISVVRMIKDDLYIWIAGDTLEDNHFVIKQKYTNVAISEIYNEIKNKINRL